MAKNPLALAQASALSMNDDIGALFARVGTTAHPRGFVLTDYRNARRAMKSALGEANRQAAVRDVFSGLKSGLRSEALSLLLDAQMLGAEESARQLRFYGIQAGDPFHSQADYEAANAALAVLLAKLEAQEAQVGALLLLDAEPAQIIGDDDRAGALRASDIAVTAATWAAALAWDAFSRWTTSHSSNQFQKQVIAALDHKTTECCLLAHGQVQPLNKLFHLTGTPRFADYLEWSPFHYYCRTSIALYMPAFDDGLTAAMRSGADQILRERAAGGSGYRAPADAYG